MEFEAVPAVLRARLGPEATGGLLELLDVSHREAREDVITACTERFDRRLVEEVSGLRVQIAHVESRIRQDMAQLGASLREDIATGRVDLFKWCCLFWVGQVLAIGGMLSVVLRVMR
jgi:hypothetical protein